MAQFNEKEGSSNSVKGGEIIASDVQGELELPLISLSPTEELPNPIPPPQDPAPAEDEVETPTIVDQLGDWFSHAARFGNRVERAYVRPCVALSLEALGASPPFVQYLETPMTLSLLLTALYFLSAIMASSLKELAILSVVLLAHSLQRGTFFALRLLKESIFSLLIFISLSITAVIGKAVLGFPFPRSVSSTTPSANHQSRAASESREPRDPIGGLSGVNLQQATQRIRSFKNELKTATQPILSQLKALNINWKKTTRITLRAVLVCSFFIFRWKTKMLITLIVGTFGAFKAIGCCRRRRARVFRFGRSGCGTRED